MGEALNDIRRLSTRARRKWSLLNTIARLLSMVLLSTAIVQFLSLDLLQGAETLLLLGFSFLPGYWLRKSVPAYVQHIHSLCLLMAVGNCTLGILFNLYRISAYYDKLLHLVNPALVAFIAFLVLYVPAAHQSGDRPLLVSSIVATGALAALLTLGLAAVWEIVEYAADNLLAQQSQGSPVMGPLDDTMWDLILGAAGSVAGVRAAALQVQKQVQQRMQKANSFAHHRV